MTEPRPAIRFFQMRTGVRVAYATHGSGPYLVCPAWWVSHVEEDWKEPGFRELFGGLAEHCTVVRYDRPGAGLSDRERRVVDLEGELDTLSELLEHLRIEELSMFAVSCAGPTALAYAARYPSRIRCLVFFGSLARGSDVGPPELKSAMQSLVRAHWGLGSRTITNLLAPDLPDAEVRRISRAHRCAADAEMAAELLALTFDADAAAVAATVGAPSLVLHRKSDHTIRHEAGRELAASMPNAKLLTLEGRAHVPWLGDVSVVRDSILEFLGAELGVNRTPSAAHGENAFLQSGDVWTLTFAGRSVHLRHALGLSDLAILLASPGQDVHAGQLWSGPAQTEKGLGADTVADEAALSAYRQRLRKVDAAIEEAEACGDLEGAGRCEDEREALVRAIRGAVGLGGRKRRLGEPAEKARKAVSARIRGSVQKISDLHPELGRHLESAIQTGMFCSYDPAEPTAWRVIGG